MRKFKIFVLILFGLLLLAYVGGRIWMEYQDRKVFEKYCNEHPLFSDSVYADDDTIQTIEEVTPQPSSTDKEYESTNSSTDNSSSYSSDDYVGPAHSHPHGTRPDDGMYGFDPLDDVDDDYNLDHFQQDAYPDDDY